MTPPTVVGLWLDGRASPETRMEAWRTLLAARAGGMAVRLYDLRPAPPLPPAPPAPPAPPDPSDAEQRLLDVLAAEGAELRAPGPAELAAALADADSIVAMSAPGRPATPALLAIDATLLALPGARLVERLRAAGQIVARAPTRGL